jgi:hypothetical protein
MIIRKKWLHLNMDLIQTVLHSGQFQYYFSFIFFSYFLVALFVVAGSSIWEDALIMGPFVFDSVVFLHLCLSSCS